MRTLETFHGGKEFQEWVRLFTGYGPGKERPEEELQEIYQEFLKFKEKKIPYETFSKGMWSFYVQEMQLGNISSETCTERIRWVMEVVPGILKVRYRVKEMTFWEWKKLYLELTSSLPVEEFFQSKGYFHKEILPMVKTYIEGDEVKIPLKEFLNIIEKVYTHV